MLVILQPHSLVVQFDECVLTLPLVEEVDTGGQTNVGVYRQEVESAGDLLVRELAVTTQKHVGHTTAFLR